MDTTKLEEKIDNLDLNLNGKQKAVAGTLNQAKGIAREALGKATNNKQMELGGKKDQAVGALQKNVGTSWAFQNKNLLVGLTTILTVAGVILYYLGRNVERVPQSSYEGQYTTH